MSRLYILIAALLVPLSLLSQVRLGTQRKFPKTVPAGDYSGIAHIGCNRYAVVSDKTNEGFYVFKIDVDYGKNRVAAVQNEGFFCPDSPTGVAGRAADAPKGARPDQEAICYVPATRTLFISRESDNLVLEYTLEGKPTGRRLSIPEAFSRAGNNYGLESLTYDSVSHRFWIVTERPLQGDSLLRLQAFGDDLQPESQYLYALEKPVKKYKRGVYVHGVSELMPLPDSRLLVLERAIRVPRPGLASYVQTWLYEVNPVDEGKILQKKLVCKWKTRINLLRRNLANYEGMCIAHQPNRADGQYRVLLIADSQNQLKGVLRDWFKVISFSPDRR